ncbi:MAG TPA: hypothetical protein VMA13_08500 [Candidatus Saccharimonadales bacterium]|nr:hypothetical protein [Candidatus Saccharimonadales bacterium]
MKDEPLQNRLRELVWRRTLTEAERAEMSAQPEARADWELESRLTKALNRLPDMAVPSNFTARVLQVVDREEVRSRRAHWQLSWRVLLPRLAVCVAVIGIAGLAYQRHEFNQRALLAKDVALVTSAQPLPSIEALKNFNAIQRMSQPHADEELLALLQ